MNLRVLRFLTPAIVLLAFAGCASVPTENSEASAAGSSTVSSSTETGSSASSSLSTAASSRERGGEKGAAAESSTSDEPKSSWRSEREKRASTAASSSSSGATGTASAAGSADTARLTEQLSEATRELATLRAANAKLRAEKAAPPKAATSSPSMATVAKPDPIDEKLAASLKSYVSFKEEVVNIFSEIERLRRENSGLSSNLRAAVEQADQARAGLARLEKEMRTEQKSRVEAEKMAAELRDQLRAVARALSAAGLSVDKLTANADSAGKRE